MRYLSLQFSSINTYDFTLIQMKVDFEELEIWRLWIFRKNLRLWIGVSIKTAHRLLDNRESYSHSLAQTPLELTGNFWAGSCKDKIHLNKPSTVYQIRRSFKQQLFLNPESHSTSFEFDTENFPERKLQAIPS